MNNFFSQTHNLTTNQNIYLQSVTFGMLFAFGLQILKQYHLVDDKNRGNLFSRGISLTAALAALVGIGVCSIFYDKMLF